MDVNYLNETELEKYKNLAIRLIEDKKQLNRLIHDFAYIVDLLADDPSNIKSWFKAKELLIKYKEYSLKN